MSHGLKQDTIRLHYVLRLQHDSCPSGRMDLVFSTDAPARVRPAGGLKDGEIQTVNTIPEETQPR